MKSYIFQKVFLALLMVIILSRGEPLFGQAHSVIDPGVVTTRQSITPAGIQSIFAGRVRAVAFCGPETELMVAVEEDVGTGATGQKFGVYLIDVLSNRVLGAINQSGSLGIRGITCVSQCGQTLVTTVQKGENIIELLDAPKAEETFLGNARTPIASATETFGWQIAARLAGPRVQGHGPAVGGISVASKGPIAVEAVTASNEIATFDLNQKMETRRIPVGIAPFTAAVDRNGAVAWVSNWGGRVPKSSDRTAAVGEDVDAERVVVDERGIAASGTVSRVDISAGRVTNEVSVGMHPTALAWDERRDRLYVANGNSDSISVVDTKSRQVSATWEIQPFALRMAGVAPTALALSPDGVHLYVACGGINAVAVVDTRTGRIAGLIPTGWYPSHLAVSPSGKILAVATLFGVGSGSDVPNAWIKYIREQQQMKDFQPGLNARHVHAYRGTVHMISVPDIGQLTAYTKAVAEDNHVQLKGAASPDRAPTPWPRPTPQPVPEHSGDPSLVEHVVYIVKENRTYDQLLGDLDRGNGDPSLVLYGEDVTPNHHRLAREFVTLDNLYATGGDSGDGHQWLTQASETDYVRLAEWTGRGNPVFGTDPIAYAQGGFLWDAVLSTGKSFIDFGEFIPAGQFPELKGVKDWSERGKLRLKLMEEWKAGERQFVHRFHVTSPIPRLDAHLARDFPSFGRESPDVVRAAIFLRYLREWERSGVMPNLTIIQLPADHTDGTYPGWNTPKADLADNDLALGQIVEGITHSQFWSKTAIFVVEDDAAAGVDHVDGHRTVAFAISPYTRRGSVDSTFYSHPSITKTIELMLGLPHLSLYELIANDMRNSFTSTKDLTPYTAVEPKQSLFDLNPPVNALKGQARRDALASMQMNWSVPDAVPPGIVNPILWREERHSTPYPGAKQALFAPYSNDLDDEETERSFRLR